MNDIDGDMDKWFDLPKDIPISYDSANYLFAKIDEDNLTIPAKNTYKWNLGRASLWPRSEAWVTRCQLHDDPYISPPHDPKTYGRRPYQPGPPLAESILSDVKPTWRGGSGPGSNFMGCSLAEGEIAGQGNVF